MPSTTIPKSFCVADLTAAGKLIKPPDVSNVTLILQSYNVKNKSWNTVNTISAMMEAKQFAEGRLQDAFRGTFSHPGMPMKWVFKKQNKIELAL